MEKTDRILALFDILYAFTGFPLLMVCTVPEATASGASVSKKKNHSQTDPRPVSERPNASVLNVRTQSSGETDCKQELKRRMETWGGRDVSIRHR